MFTETGQWANEGFMMSYHVDNKTQMVGKPLASSNGDRQHTQHHKSYVKGVDEVIIPFLVKRAEMIGEVKKLLNLNSQRPEPVLVMCANGGHLPLILNFVCHLRYKGLTLPKHVFICSSERYCTILYYSPYSLYCTRCTVLTVLYSTHCTSDAALLKTLGLVTYYHDALGMGIPGRNGKNIFSWQ
jgi:hypothetical protein